MAEDIQTAEIAKTQLINQRLLANVGNSLEKVITIVDEDKNFTRVTGAMVANPALKERYFSNFITQVENSGMFKKVEVINKKTTSGMDIDNMSFELKCEL